MLTATVADICFGRNLKRPIKLFSPFEGCNSFKYLSPRQRLLPSFRRIYKIYRILFNIGRKFLSIVGYRFLIVILTLISNSIHEDYTKKLILYTCLPKCFIRWHTANINSLLLSWEFEGWLPLPFCWSLNKSEKRLWSLSCRIFYSVLSFYKKLSTIKKRWIYPF